MAHFSRPGTVVERISEALGGVRGDLFCRRGRLVARLRANLGVLERSLGVPNPLRGHQTSPYTIFP
eukprot:4604057-Pyramimonas_sp.AAC.1